MLMENGESGQPGAHAHKHCTATKEPSLEHVLAITPHHKMAELHVLAPTLRRCTVRPRTVNVRALL